MTLNTIKTGGTFQTQFNRFIKEEIGIHYIYPEQTSYLKKKATFEERQQKVEKMLEKVEYEDEKLSASEEALQQWSDEALELNLFIKKLGLMPDICAEEYLVNFFETLYFRKLGIESIDPLLAKFNNLNILNLSFNKIQKIENLPKNIKELYLTGNVIDQIACKSQTLIHLGLGYNRITNQGLTDITNAYPNLFCLDLSQNDVESLVDAVNQLSRLQKLKMLYLLGNPLCFAPRYRDIIKQNFQNLVLIDDVQAFSDSESPKKRKKKRDDPLLGQRIEIKDDCVIDFQLRVLQNIDGIYLTEDICKPEILDTLQEFEKSSVFWLSFTNHLGEIVETDRKIWILNFLVDKEAGVGKTDFGYKQRWTIKTSYELREWLRKTVLVELWETRPKIIEKKQEDETIVKEVVMNYDNKPFLDKRLRGVIPLNLTEWISKPELTQEDLQTHQRQFFFDSKYKLQPEFMFLNQLVSLKEPEKQFLVEYLVKKEEEALQKINQELAQKAAASQPLPGGKQPAKPDPKKDPKAQAAGAKKGQQVEDKNAPKTITVDYPETPLGPNFMILEKNYAQMKASIQNDITKKEEKTKKIQIKETSQEEKKAIKLRELTAQYNIIRSLPFNVAIKTRLNLPEEVEVKPEPVLVVDPKKKK